MKTKSEGWSSSHCTKPKCRTALDAGAGIQFYGPYKKEERYCWKHWQEYNRDPKIFPGMKESS
jgi:hypothetical protein